MVAEQDKVRVGELKWDEISHLPNGGNAKCRKYEYLAIGTKCGARARSIGKKIFLFSIKNYDYSYVLLNAIHQNSQLWPLLSLFVNYSLILKSTFFITI